MMLHQHESRPVLPMVRQFAGFGIALAVGICAISIRDRDHVNAAGPAGAEWHEYAGDVQGTKYSPLNEITKDNVRKLEVAWRWTVADRSLQTSNPNWGTGQYEDTPLMANGTLYTITGLGLVAALDPGTGETRWVFDPESYRSGRPNNLGFIQRGMAYWTDGRKERLLIGTGDAYLISVDTKTGKADPAFGASGKVDLTIGVPRAIRATNFSARRPLVAGDVVVVGNSVADAVIKLAQPPGYVHAFDVRTGKLLWTFHTVPLKGEFGYDTWQEGSAEYSGSANVWAGMSYDPELDYVYLPSSAPTNNTYGGHRRGDNLFSDTLLCVEARTGKRVWHFQAVHHDLWDYDFPAQPVLGDITVAGRRIKAVMQVSKHGFTYAFDRKTGAAVWPIEERPVPQTSVPREYTSRTQPFPTKPPAFELQGSIEENLIDFTPELRKRAAEKLQSVVHGPIFTPPSEKGTVFLPGVLGGANWGGAGFDPETGVLYVPSEMRPAQYQTTRMDPARSEFFYDKVTSPLGVPTVDGLPLFKPPYSKVTALDMNRGERLWVSPIGNGPRNHPLLKDLKLPPLGDFGQGGSVLVTKTLLFITVAQLGGGRPLERWEDPEEARNVLYVFDKNSGALMHAMNLGSDSAAAPMTYQYAGRQYLIVAIGRGRRSELIALRLSQS
jgi:quinoprotein glucose dehydrogenase